MSKTKFTGKAIDRLTALVEHVRENVEWKEDVIGEKEKGAVLFGSLPEGLDRETVEKYENHRNDVINALHVVMPEMAADKFHKDKDLQRVKGSVSIGTRNDTVTLTMDKERNFPIPGTDRKAQKFMHVTTSEKIGGRGLKAIQEEVSAQFKESLGF